MTGSSLYGIAVVLITAAAELVAQTPLINEVVYSNVNGITDLEGDTNDWLEIYNPGTSAINLAGWQLTDDTSKSSGWRFPSFSLEADHFLIVFLSGKDRYQSGELHADFKLRIMEEPVCLLDPDGQIISFYEVQCVPPGLSVGSKPDGSENRVLMVPSPGTTNNHSETVQIYFREDSLIFSHPGGFYQDSLSLHLLKTEPENQIYYTLDGTLPDEQSILYESPILLTERTGQENRISDIRTSKQWIEPGDAILKFPVVRAAVFSEGCIASEVVSNTYFTGRPFFEEYGVPVVSIITDPDNLFDKEEGIYVEGNQHNNYDQRGDDWERPANLQYFDKHGKLVLTQNMGIRIHGGGSRSAPQKSLRLYARREYGEEWFSYRFFSQKKDLERFRTLILRSVRDWSGTLFKEELCHRLVQNLDVDYMAGQTVVGFINGEYWGIHSLRERQDEHYIMNNHPSDCRNFDIIEHKPYGINIVEGDDTEFRALMSMIEEAGSSGIYDYGTICKIIDIQNFIDYYIAEIYLANYDFPQNNVKYWRPGSGEGRWRLFFYDCDACMSLSYHDLLSEFTSPVAYLQSRPEWSTRIFRSLLEIPEFRQHFQQQFYLQLNHTFHPDTVIRWIDHYQTLYQPLAPDHIYRWHIPNSMLNWNGNVQNMKLFALQRPSQVVAALQNHFGTPVAIYPNPNQGTFDLNTMFSDGEIVIEISNIAGSIVYRNTLVSPGDSGIRLAVPLPEGFYLLRVITGTLTGSTPLLIQ